MNLRRPSFQKSLLTHSGEDLPLALKSSIGDQQAQARLANQVVSTQKQIPKGMREGDLGTRVFPGGIVLGVSDSRGTVREVALQSGISQWLPDQVASGVPTLAHFPNNGDFGWYENSAGPTLYWARNRQGVILKIALT